MLFLTVGQRPLFMAARACGACADILCEISGFSGIGAGHDREDFIFREDFTYLFDANLT
jgi:hypothetical protein